MGQLARVTPTESTMAKLKIKVPTDLKKRLKDVAKKHDFANVDAVVAHFIDKGLNTYKVPNKSASVEDRLAWVVDDQGYSSADELVEHLLLRGLGAYEDAPDDPEKLAERLRGLGYIE
jgi:hypothetical protein